METLIQIDKELLLWLNSFHTPFWDVIIMIFTRKEFWIPLYFTLIYQIYKFKGKEALWWIIGIVLVVVLSDQISTLFFKDVFERFRPSHDPSLKGMVNLVSNYTGGKYGFVSSHATNSFAFAIFSALLFQNKLYTAFIFTWSLLIIYTRVYLGVHFPGDVLGGMLLGLLIGYGIYHLTQWGISKYRLSNHSAKPKRLDYKSVYWIICVASAEIITICLVVKKLLKYGMFS
ncbi:phosphatase PAP2 family protein [Labilibaculum sp.]|uniref:phosphatase PAP2 family protein n=1 Tax=Labilibaculum sp. TaxID=2060723 RepID=UPI003564DE01